MVAETHPGCSSSRGAVQPGAVAGAVHDSGRATRLAVGNEVMHSLSW